MVEAGSALEVGRQASSERGVGVWTAQEPIGGIHPRFLQLPPQCVWLWAHPCRSGEEETNRDLPALAFRGNGAPCPSPCACRHEAARRFPAVDLRLRLPEDAAWPRGGVWTAKGRPSPREKAPPAAPVTPTSPFGPCGAAGESRTRLHEALAHKGVLGGREIPADWIDQADRQTAAPQSGVTRQGNAIVKDDSVTPSLR